MNKKTCKTNQIVLQVFQFPLHQNINQDEDNYGCDTGDCERAGKSRNKQQDDPEDHQEQADVGIGCFEIAFTLKRRCGFISVEAFGTLWWDQKKQQSIQNKYDPDKQTFKH